MSEKKQKTLAALGVAVFVLLSLAVAWFIGVPLIRYMRTPEEFRLWVNAHGIGGRIVFVAMMLLQVVVAIIPGEPLELGAGYAFGFVEGTLLCEAAILLGSCAVFLFVRKFGRRAAEIFFPAHKLHSLKFLQSEKRLTFWVFLLFFIPGTPKDILTYVVPLTPMPLPTFLLITCIARLPSLLSSTAGGAALGIGRIATAAIVFGATAVVSALGVAAYRFICKKHKEE